MYPAIFLDRDDTLIDDMGYSADPARVRLRPGAAAAIHRLREAGYYIIVVTNQSGVARGYFTEEQLAAAHQRMQELLRAQDTGVDAVYYCPFLAGNDAIIEQYRRDSDLRKPKPGMLLQAAEEMQLDLAQSWMIGDAVRDAEAGRAAGCRTVLVTTSASMRNGAADYTAPHLGAAVDIVLNGRGGAAPGTDSHAAPPVAGPAQPAATDESPPAAERTASDDDSPLIAPELSAGTAPSDAGVERYGKGDTASDLGVGRYGKGDAASDLGVGRYGKGDMPFDAGVGRDEGDSASRHAEQSGSAAATAAAPAPRSIEETKAEPGDSAPPPSPAALPSPAPQPSPGREQALLDGLLSEVRQWRRESRNNEFTAAQIVGGIAQAFAAAALFWGLFGLFDDTAGSGRALELRFLIAMALQLVALTYLRAKR